MLFIPAQIYEEMLAHLRRCSPDEGCGLLGGQGGLVSRHYPTENVAPEDKPKRYLVNPRQQLQAQEQLEAANLELSAIYHSHIHTPAYPSPTDVRTAYYPDSYYVLVSFAEPANPVIRAYKIVKPDLWGESGEIVEQEWQVT